MRVRGKAGLLAVGAVVALTVAWLWPGRTDGPGTEPAAAPAVTASDSRAVVPGPVAGLTVSGLTAGWEKVLRTTAKHPRGQVSVAKGDVALTVVPLPDDADTAWGISCARYGKPAPHDTTALFELCWPTGADDPERAKVAAWLAGVPADARDARHRFDGYTAVVEYAPPGTYNNGPDPDPDRDGSALKIYLTGGSGQPGLT
jgi:hypothetical protein